MPCLCSSPERKSTSKTLKRTRAAGMAIAMGACVTREFSTTVRLAGGLAIVLGASRIFSATCTVRIIPATRQPSSIDRKPRSRRQWVCQAQSENACREEGVMLNSVSVEQKILHDKNSRRLLLALISVVTVVLMRSTREVLTCRFRTRGILG